MGGWVKWEKDKEQEPGFKRLVRKVRNTCVTGALPPETLQSLSVTLTMGALLKFWSFADTYIRADDTLDMGPDDIDDLVGISGFAAAMPAGWLRVIDAEHVELPGYQSHNGIEAKKAALSQKRMENKRTRDLRNDSVTLRAQGRNGRVTGASPDQTRPDQTRPVCKSAAIAAGGTAEGDAAGRTAGNGRQVPDPHTHTEPVDSLEFEQAIMAKYPKGPNPPNWQGALLHARALVDACLSTWPELVAVTERYAAYIASGGSTVNIAAHNFFDRRKGNHWQQLWDRLPSSCEATDPVLTWRPPPDDDEDTPRANG